MNKYFQHELKQNENGEYEILIFLEDDMTEFASELGNDTGETKDFVTSVRGFIREKYPKVRVTVVKVVIGGLAITSIPLLGGNISSVEAATAPTSSQVSQESSIYYYVSPGDTLWSIARSNQTTVNDIKQANHLITDAITTNQRLIIPKTFHSVEKGDSLYSLAQKYGTTVDAITSANDLRTFVVNIGQVLIIPKSFGEQVVTDKTEVNQSTYTVSAGDSLWSIANRFGTSVHALKTSNNLSSDTLSVGQKLSIPASETVQVDTKVPSTENIQYQVVAGDSLWGISQKYGVSVDAIRSSNNLDSDNLRVGQLLVIPKQEAGVLVPPLTPAKAPVTANYTVVKGDTLYSIANRHHVTVDSIKSVNQLASNSLFIGQVIKIPGTNSIETGGTGITTGEVGLQEVQASLQKLGYYAVPTITGTYDSPTTTAIKNFQADYGLTVTGKIDSKTTTAIEHAVVKQALIKDTKNYLGVPYLWGGTTPSGFDCSGFVYFMFNKHGVDMSRNTSAGLYKQGQAVSQSDLQPGDLVFYSTSASGSITHVGFYIGDNQWVSATNSKGIAIYSLDNPYWVKYYVGAKRIY
ncbi:C40 family peptidase [Ornithinibacillus scapharcae]|uniref:C40 family peptidase n=1 Tax=Ornithinibacillus scapharcae TaxID=1147159 RepID=UPI000225B8E7|nr:LysM peptidoglycan-binding domain-containing protein [Ornithinibacillus scapharcae]